MRGRAFFQRLGLHTWESSQFLSFLNSHLHSLSKACHRCLRTLSPSSAPPSSGVAAGSEPTSLLDPCKGAPYLSPASPSSACSQKTRLRREANQRLPGSGPPVAPASLLEVQALVPSDLAVHLLFPHLLRSLPCSHTGLLAALSPGLRAFALLSLYLCSPDLAPSLISFRPLLKGHLFSEPPDRRYKLATRRCLRALRSSDDSPTCPAFTSP